ncbi:MAG: S-methyl-5-thioribose-1-phosphate isomerase [Peptococcaceae bacterium]|nr:S-methyl-5-thioribose-1-phosphate isomerase [Peptococcaceae bacterium]
MSSGVCSLRWEGDALVILDQTRLPDEVSYITTADYRVVAGAIKDLKVRGAPAIGAAAAFALVLGAREALGSPRFRERVREVAAELTATRPTAVNLRWAVSRLLECLSENQACDRDLVDRLALEARAVFQEDVEGNRRLGRYGQTLVPQGSRILTHCNAGALATSGYGTALGVVRAAVEAGKKVTVYAGETRPLLQGARLTVWELVSEGVETFLVTDSMAGWLMAKGMVDLVLLGADRIAGNGDVANKIGTYSLAVLAAAHGMPFYVAAPVSTLDLSLASGAEIPIEERAESEVTGFGGRRTAPAGVRVFNPAFDVTPARLVTAIITDRGVVYPPYGTSLPGIFGA